MEVEMHCQISGKNIWIIDRWDWTKKVVLVIANDVLLFVFEVSHV